MATIVGSFKLQVSLAKETYKRDHILQKRPIILRSLQIVATPYTHVEPCVHDTLATQHLQMLRWVVGLKLCLELVSVMYYIDSCIIHRFLNVLCIHMWWVVELKLCLELVSVMYYIDFCIIHRFLNVLCIHMWRVVELKLCLEPGVLYRFLYHI